MYLNVVDDFKFGGVMELGVACSYVTCEGDLFWWVGWFSVDVCIMSLLEGGCRLGVGICL
jgi:hypothetical protein